MRRKCWSWLWSKSGITLLLVVFVASRCNSVSIPELLCFGRGCLGEVGERMSERCDRRETLEHDAKWANGWRLNQR